jgi:integrase
MSNLTLDGDNPLQMFLYALRAPESKRQYPRRLKVFLDYLTNKGELKCSSVLEDECKEFLLRIKENPKWGNGQLMEFILFERNRAQRGEIVITTIRNYLKATKLFLEMNSDVPLVNWKRVIKCLPTPKNTANDRAPTIEEIKKLIDYPDRRIKPIILSMVSGGFRIGAWDYLQQKHVTPIKDKTGYIVAAKMVIYATEPEEYFCFITPEAYHALSEWMEFRKNSGEDVTEESFLMRDIWPSTEFDTFKNSTLGLVKYPKKLKSTGIKSLIERAMRSQGLAKPLPKGVRRRAWKSGHGYRKFFKTQAEQVMKPANVEMLSGRDIGISQTYYKPTEHQLLEDYLKAIPLLTINEDNRLKIENEQLRGENKYGEYIMREKLEEKDNEINSLKEQELNNAEAIAALSDKLMSIEEDMQKLKSKQ